MFTLFGWRMKYEDYDCLDERFPHVERPSMKLINP
jgi:hypothetical protein